MAIGALCGTLNPKNVSCTDKDIHSRKDRFRGVQYNTKAICRFSAIKLPF